jgi:phosphoglycerate dehydrogenase-like enzyme
MKILIASPIDDLAIEALKTKHDVNCAFGVSEADLLQVIRDREVLVFRSGVKIDKTLLENAPALKLIVRAGSGVDNIDLEYVYQRGVEFHRIPGPGAEAVAELAFTFMLAMSRRLFEADKSMREAHWAKFQLSGYLIRRKVLGIVGMGDIGTHVAEMGRAWNMHVIGCVEKFSLERAAKFHRKEIDLLGIGEVIEHSDYLCLHVPLKDNTRNLINAGVLARMKPGSYLINLARGGVVDEQALYDALTNGNTVRGAALDVHKNEGEGKLSPLASLPNVILTPHIGAMAVDAQREIGRIAVELINSFGVPTQVQ